MEIRINDRVVKFDPSKIIKALEKILDKSGIYDVLPDGTLRHLHVDRKSGQTVAIPFSNFTPVVIQEINIDDGIEPRSEYEFGTFMNGRVCKRFRAGLKEVSSPQGDLLFGGGCRLFPDARGGRGWYNDVIRLQCGDVPSTTVYTHLGWHRIDDKWVYLNGGYSVTAEGLTDKYNVEMESDRLNRYFFVKTHSGSKYKTLLEDLPKVAPKNVIYPLLAYTFLSPLNEMLRDVGYEPRFIMYLIGRTSSHKTTLMYLFLSFFGRFRTGEGAPISLCRDTPNSAEKILAVGNSICTGADDRVPDGSNKNATARVEENEQTLLRDIGDRACRNRLANDSANSFRKALRPKCNLIITSEEKYRNLTESSIARAFTCGDLKPDTVDRQALTVAQNKAGELNECMGEYIQYLIIHWSEVSEKCEKMFLEYREKAQNGGHGRLAESVAHLEIGISVMCDWLLSKSVIGESDSEALQNEAWSIFMELSTEQNRRIYEEKPTKLFTDAVREMLASGDIAFLPLRGDKGDGGISIGHKTNVGYKDDKFYYARKDKLYGQVWQFYLAQGNTFPLSSKTIYDQMCDEGLIDPTYQTDGKTRKQTTKNLPVNVPGGRQGYVWIWREVFEESEDTET